MDLTEVRTKKGERREGEIEREREKGREEEEKKR